MNIVDTVVLSESLLRLTFNGKNCICFTREVSCYVRPQVPAPLLPTCSFLSRKIVKVKDRLLRWVSMCGTMAVSIIIFLVLTLTEGGDTHPVAKQFQRKQQKSWRLATLLPFWRKSMKQLAPWKSIQTLVNLLFSQNYELVPCFFWIPPCI